MTKDVTVVILAGGKGTRLAPYTTVLPKPLMPVGDMPILEIVVRQCWWSTDRHNQKPHQAERQ